MWRYWVMLNKFHKNRLHISFILASVGICLGFVSPCLFAKSRGKRDMFKECTGVSERVFRGYGKKARKQFYRDKVKPNAGTYKEYTIKELLRKTKNKQPFGGQGCFKIVYNKTVQEFFEDDNFAGAAFQSASDLTGLEGGIVYDREYLNSMLDRCQQGESVAFGTFYGNIERKYYKPKINLLDSVSGVRVKGQSIIGIPTQIDEDDLRNFKIGYQKNTRVAFEAHPTHKNSKGLPDFRTKKGDMRVDQAIAYSMSLNSHHTKNLIGQHGKKLVRAFAKQLVKKTYQATILAAYHNDRQRIVLTLVGAGVYGNPLDWALEAIEDMLPFIAEKNMQVYLNVLTDKNRAKIDKLKTAYRNNLTNQSSANKSVTDILQQVKRVEVCLFTRHPSEGDKLIMFTGTSRWPNYCDDGQGYWSCFPGIERNPEESWEYNSARGFNEKTFFWFARLLDKEKKLFYRRLYSEDDEVRENYRDKANKIIARRLKKAPFEQVNKDSRLYFLYMPYDNFDKDIRARNVHNQRLALIKRFGASKVIASDSIRPGKYFNWVNLPEDDSNCVTQAFNGRELGFSPFVIPAAYCL